MGRGAQQRYTEVIHVNREMPEGLDRIGMQRNFSFPGNPADLLQRLNTANLVIGVHHGDQNRFFRNGFLHILRVQDAEAVHRQKSHAESLFFQVITGLQDGVMFNPRRNYMVAFLPEGRGHTF